MIPDQDPGTVNSNPGRAQPGKAQPGKAQPGKDKPKKGKEYFFEFGPVGRAAPQECVGRS